MHKIRIVIAYLTQARVKMSVRCYALFLHNLNIGTVMEWEEKGVPFRSHAYVPEVHPLTKTDFHEREDEGHLFKVKQLPILIIMLKDRLLSSPA